MHKIFLPIFALAFVVVSMPAPAAFAQGRPGSNGVWTSSGQSAWPSTQNASSSSATKTTGFTQTNNNSHAPVVSAVDFVYDDVQKIEMLQITGANFSPYKEKVRVTVSGAQASILRSDPRVIMAVLPSGAANIVKVSVETGGQTVLKDKEIRIPPRVTGVSLLSGPPGTPITIYGTHFADTLARNKVYIGGAQAELSGGSKTALMTAIPFILSGQSPTWGAPVVVIRNGLSSKADVTIRIQNRVY